MSFCSASLTVRVVVNNIESILVESRSQVRLSDAKADAVCKALAKRAGGHLDTVGVTSLGMTGRQRIDLTELLQVVHGELVAE